MQIMSPPFWLMMVSRMMAVLPVWRSPIINSRWPRPMGIIASMALMPVCKGSRTGCRSTTPGAMRSIALRWLVTMGPLPSSGTPRGLTTRPTKASPTGADMIERVRLTVSPSSMAVHSPDAVSHGDDRADLIDGHRLIVIGDLRAKNLGNFVRFNRCHATTLLFGLEADPQSFKLRAHRAIVNRRTNAHDRPADQSGIAVIMRFHAPAAQPLERGLQLLFFAFLQIPRRNHARPGHALEFIQLGFECLLNFGQQRHAALINHHEQEVSQRPAGLHALHQGLRHAKIIGARHGGAAEKNAQLRRFPQEREEIAQFLTHRLRTLL